MAYIRVDDENILAHKIQIIIWEKQLDPKGIYFSYSEDEKFLIDFLKNNPTISFSKFIRLAHISRKKAEEILSNFVIMDILIMNTSSEGNSFSLNKNIPDLDLERFK